MRFFTRHTTVVRAPKVKRSQPHAAKHNRVTVDVPPPQAMTLRSYLPVKQLHESKALALRDATPINKKGKHVLHLADASTQVLQASPSLWLLYQQAIRDGHPSEFQRPKRKPARPTPKDKAWWVIEDLSRTLVAASSEVCTLRTAVMRVVAANPALYDVYANAHQRAKRLLPRPISGSARAKARRR